MVIAIQLALLAAVQEALAGLVETVTLPVPPVAGKLAVEALNENTDFACAGGASAVTVTTTGRVRDRPPPVALIDKL